MAQVVSEWRYTPESSIQMTRPDFKTLLVPDTNVGETDVTTYNEARSRQQLHVPNVSGQLNYDVNCCENKSFSAPAPGRSASSKKRVDIQILDPITGFLSTAGEAVLQTGKCNMPSFGKARLEPQNLTPQNAHSIRVQPEAIDELKRTQEGESEPELKWNSQKVIDVALKSRLGGWTSKYDPRSQTEKKSDNPYRLNDIFPNMKITYKNDEERDEFAKNYRYTTSTQQMYRQINWDSKLPKKLHAPVTTYEAGRADPLRPVTHCSSKPEISQTSSGMDWDRQQNRNGYLTREEVAFTAPTKKGSHIPGYSGHIGGKNREFMEDVIENFKPFTILRTTQPKQTESNYKTNIPGYTGKSHYFKTNSVSHYDNHGRPYTTTAAYHREIPRLEETKIEKSLYGDFSRIQTKVPPQNPYDNVNRHADVEINHSMDHMKYPTVNAKHTNHVGYLTHNRENEIKSILKKTNND